MICLQISTLILYFSRCFLFFLIATKNDGIYKNLAKKLCSIEHNYFLERDRIKIAAKQTDVDGFDEVFSQNTMQNYFSYFTMGHPPPPPLTS